MIDFGEKLKQLRIQTGLTQQQLANQIGVTKSVISYYELQERYPSPEVLVKIAAVFHVSTDYLLGFESKHMIDVTGLSDKDISAIITLIDSLKEKNKD